MINIETWKYIKGYENLYEVSNTGKVKRINKTKPFRILKQTINKDGYYQVTLCKCNKKTTYRVHRLVATAFIENANNYPLVNHKDENKLNNNAENLEWCDCEYNTNYHGAAFRRGKSRRKPIAQLDMKGDIVRLWDSRTEIVETLRFSGGNITSCCLGLRHTSHGYKWRYATPDELADMKARWGGA